jgi:hypothetical protein
VRAYYLALSHSATLNQTNQPSESLCNDDNDSSSFPLTFDDLYSYFLASCVRGYVILMMSYDVLRSLLQSPDEEAEYLRRVCYSTRHFLYAWNWSLNVKKYF